MQKSSPRLKGTPTDISHTKSSYAKTLERPGMYQAKRPMHYNSSKQPTVSTHAYPGQSSTISSTKTVMHSNQHYSNSNYFKDLVESSKPRPVGIRPEKSNSILLGKRLITGNAESEKKENSSVNNSSSKTKQDRIKELEERYKQFSEKIIGKNSTQIGRISPNPNVVQLADSNAEQLLSDGSTPRKVLVDDQVVTSMEIIKPAEEENTSFVISSEEDEIKCTPKKSNLCIEKVSDFEIISVKESPVPVATSKSVVAKFLPDPSTRLAYRAYAARTNNGLFRNYNEDRVSIIQKIYVDQTQDYPTSFFGLFDGHSGASCADYLRDNLHQFVTKQGCYRKDKSKALREGLIECETKFLDLAKQTTDNSGACAIVCLLENTKAYIANVGDSRAVLSRGKGRMAQQVTQDHKPEANVEKERIFANGGGIFRSKKCAYREFTDCRGKVSDIIEDTRYGPYRVDPGGLSVSRTIGDLQAKDIAMKGNPRCIVPHPDCYEVDITSDTDFAVIACDGVFDVLNNKDVIDGVWTTLKQWTSSKGLKEACRLASEFVMKMSFDKKSMDNITVIVIAFQDESYYF